MSQSPILRRVESVWYPRTARLRLSPKNFPNAPIKTPRFKTATEYNTRRRLVRSRVFLVEAARSNAAAPSHGLRPQSNWRVLGIPRACRYSPPDRLYLGFVHFKRRSK